MAGAFLGGLIILSCLSTVGCSDCDILLKKKKYFCREKKKKKREEENDS
jgi:hypothetical protein